MVTTSQLYLLCYSCSLSIFYRPNVTSKNETKSMYVCAILLSSKETKALGVPEKTKDVCL